MNAFLKISSIIAASVAAGVSASACGDDESSNDGDSTGGAAGVEQDASAGGSNTGGGGTGTGGGSAGSGGRTDAGSGGMTGDAGGECASGCQCAMEEVCDYSCASGCMVECLGGICSADCAGGSCALDSDFGGLATYTCDGGGCIVDCDNGSTCSLDCAGGGCTVECDADSTCTVECSEDGDPCEVLCANGGRATCEGNCMLQGCDASCEPDPSYMPNIVPAEFTDTVDNPLFPLPVGMTLVYQAPGEVITITVTNQAKTVMGVDVVVVHDEVRSTDGELIEDTYDWFAQDADGNVWYFGEETAEYVNGMVATTAGSWEAGIDGALPGVIMYADPTVGRTYRQEYYACEAEDMGEVVEVDVSVTANDTDYEGCVRIRDFTPLDPGSNEIKTFCPGIGVVEVLDVRTGVVVERLDSVTLP